MKLLRVFLIGAAAILVLLLIAVALAFNSSFQTWAARRALAGQPDLKASIGRVSAGLNRVELQDVRAEIDGAVLTLPALETELPLLAAGLDKKVAIHRLVAKGWKLDLTHAVAVAPAPASSSGAATPAKGTSAPASAASPAPAAAAKAAFQGIFSQLHLPVDVAVDGVDLEGEVILPALQDRAASVVKVSIRGGGVGPGKDGALTADLDGTDSQGGKLSLHAVVRPAMDTPTSFSRFAVTSEATATGAQFPQGVKLGVEASAARTATGEAYHLVLTGEGKPLVVADATFAAGNGRIAGTWKLNLRHSDLAPFALGQPLPEFTAAGEGSFETEATFSEIHAVGRLDASADHLQAVRKELSALGRIKLTADFDLLQHANSLRIERLTAEIAGAKPVASVRALQAFEFNLTTGELRVADPAQDLLGLSLHGLPLAWAAPFLGDLKVTGDDVRGEFAVSAREGGLTLRPRAPLTIGHLSVAQAGQPLVSALDLSLKASADYTPRGWQAEVAELSVHSAGRRLLLFDAKAGQLAGRNQPLKATGHWSADLPALLAQPAAAGGIRLASGVAEGDFTASVDAVQSLQLKATVKNLVAETKEKLPELALDVRADVAANGRITFALPLVVTQDGRKSDLSLAGTATPTKSGLSVEAQVQSEQIVAEDMQLLLLPLGGGPESAPVAKTAAKPAGPDAKPFWTGLDGQLTLALKKVTYRGSFTITHVGGTLRLDPAVLKIEAVKAVFGADSDLKFAGDVKFAAKTKQPYTLASDLTVTNFDAGAAFRALDPAKLPTIEGKLNVTSHLASQGINIGDVVERARGDFLVTGRGGIFRALSSDISDKVQKTQSAVSAIGGILGSVTGKKDYGEFANKSQVVAEVAKVLSEIPFDQLSVTASRAENLDLQLKDFTLISPELRLGGTGSIRHVEGKPLLEQPLTVALTLGSRGRLGDLMKKGGLLDEKSKDNLGYTAFFTPVKVGGTLQSPDTSELRSALLSAALEKNGGLLNGLLGK